MHAEDPLEFCRCLKNSFIHGEREREGTALHGSLIQPAV